MNISANGPEISENIVARFLFGLLDGQQKSASFNDAKYRTQEEISKAITKVSDGKYQYAQPTMSNAIRKLRSDILEYDGKQYLLRIVNGVYQLQTVDDAARKAKAQIEEMNAFDCSSLYRNAPNKFATCFGFKIKSENDSKKDEQLMRQIVGLFQEALNDTLFEWYSTETGILLLIDNSQFEWEKETEWLFNLQKKLIELR